MADKPTFTESLKAGVLGMIKGAVILGAVGLIAGAVIGAGIGLASGVPGAAVAGAIAMAGSFAGMGVSIGSLIGAVTGVVQTREVQATDPQDIINLANISFAQGVEAGRSKQVSQEAAKELEQASSRFQDKLTAEKKHEQGIVR